MTKLATYRHIAVALLATATIGVSGCANSSDPAEKCVDNASDCQQFEQQQEQQKNQEAKEGEVNKEVEAIREAKRLRSEE